MKCLCCDFGGSSVKYAVVDELANMTHAGKLPAPLESAEQFADTVYELYARFANEVQGVAVSLPGYINPETGYLLDSGVYVPLYGRNVAELIESRCRVPAAVENDGKCGALSEAWKGALADCRDGAVIILGSGIAGGVIKDRRIHSGNNCVAGEFSYALTDTGDRTLMGAAFMSSAMLGITYKLCKAKNLDMSVQDSSDAILMLEGMFGARYPKPEGEPKRIKADGRQFFKWLAEGDADALKIYGECISSLAALVLNIEICFAPQKIVIGGGLSRQERLITDLRAELSALYSGMGISPLIQCEVVTSKYLDECNLVGAMANYLIRYRG